jgi:probable F420-dependent oxidoreductase
LSFVAAVTSRIKLGTAAVILPEHHPLILAKSVAHLDVLSEGRAVLGVGVGWLKEEYDALGIDFTTRGRRMNAAIDGLRNAWAQGPSTYESDFFSWHEVESNPKPVSPDGVPIHIAGHSPAAARRAARRGDGFIPGIASPPEFADVVAPMYEECAKLGRDPNEIELTAGCSGRPYSADEIRQFEELGATRVHAAFLAETAEGLVEAMTEYAETTMSATGAEI